MNFGRVVLGLLLLFVVNFASRATAASAQADSGPPNILYIMSDDHAATAISCYGSRLAKVAPTPNIDRLAKEGARLTHVFCTNAICTPSRAAILTGQYSQKNGVYTLGDQLDPAHPNVAKLLEEAGYQRAIIGKWHLKTDPTGFDYWNVLPGQGKYHNPVLIENGTEKQHQGYSADVITDLSLAWLKGRDPDRPFFLMHHFKAPHGKWEYAERHAKLFSDVEIPAPGSLWEDKSHRSIATRDRGSDMVQLSRRMNEDNWPTGRLDTTGMDEHEAGNAAYQKYMKEYLRAVAAVDENVGRLLDYLDAEGLTENTVVMYTADQGMFLGEHGYYDKRWIYEEALRMPMLVRYPAEIPAGSVNSDMTLNVDFAPTFLGYAGLTAPDDMQGRNFRWNLVDRRPADWRTAMYYRYWMHLASHDNPAHYGIRTKQYKLIFFYGLPLDARGAAKRASPAGWEFYNLEKDPHELANVYDDPRYARVIRELKRGLLHLKQELGDTDEKYPELMEVRAAAWD